MWDNFTGLLSQLRGESLPLTGLPRTLTTSRCKPIGTSAQSNENYSVLYLSVFLVFLLLSEALVFAFDSKIKHFDHRYIVFGMKKLKTFCLIAIRCLDKFSSAPFDYTAP